MKTSRSIAACCTLFASAAVSASPPSSSPGTDAGSAAPDFRRIVKSATDRVFPAVVYIKVIRESLEEGEKTSQSISGSGVIISCDGEVLTNWHVVEKATEVRCQLFDGRAMDAKVVGTDKDTDLALLKLKVADEDVPLPHATLGDSSVLDEGDFVMAMGAPWGMNRSVSIGIVSCTRRYLPDHSEYSLWIQTDAAISPGNSGGPLVNTAGEIIGINTRGIMFGGDMGFAIPSITARLIVPQLREHGQAHWSWTGLRFQPLRDFDRNIYFEADRGVIVADTDPDSPARQAGIQTRDRLIRVNGKSVSAFSAEDLPSIRRAFGLLEKGKVASIELVRKGKTIALELTPREKGSVEGDALDCPRWDLTVKTINQFENADLYFHRQKGVYIYGLKYPGNARNTNLRWHDILLKVDRHEVVTLDDVRRIHAESLENIEKKPRLVLTVLRNGLMRQTVLDISREYERE
ncbi:MAG: trypsin-like peptidase domain-containing protein [Planctomycetota bacterium]|nr:trypsin-like peptidase domain-containing protein [Planctomycetota bacterium]